MVSFLILIFLLGPIVSFWRGDIITSYEPITQEVDTKITSSYTSHSAFNITLNSDFVLLGWNGSGTEEDPYSISGLLFDMDFPIRVANTTAFFSIENCYFTSRNNERGTAISMDNVTNGNVQSCLFESIFSSVKIHQCNETTIQMNTMRNVSNGIELFNASGFKILSNQIENVTDGINLYHIYDSIISMNTVHDCKVSGVRLGGGGPGTIFSNNEIYNVIDEFGFLGALFVGGYGWLIQNNYIHNSPRGISAVVFEFENSTITGNDIADCSQGVFLSLSEDINISNNEISNSSYGIYLWDCAGIEIQSNAIESNYLGVSIQNTLHMKLTNNQFSYGGIAIDGGSPSQYRHEISGNTIDGRSIGYLIDEVDLNIADDDYGQLFVINGTRVSIQNQHLENAAIGVTLAFSTECEVKESEITNNSIGGIRMIYTESCTISDSSIFLNGKAYSSEGGILGIATNNTSILNNLIYMNNGNGIELRSSTYGFIYNNLVTNNSEIGIFLSVGSKANLAYGNAIGWNGYENAVDEGMDNSWDDGNSLGNWWSDYNRTSSIVYEVEGSANSQDNYPKEYNSLLLELPIQVTKLSLEIITISVIGVLFVIVVGIAALRKKQFINTYPK